MEIPADHPETRHAASGLLSPGLVLALLLTLTVLASWLVQLGNKRSIAVAAETAAEDAADTVSRRLALYEQGLNAIRGAVVAAGVDGLTDRQFEQFANSLKIETDFPGAFGLGFARRVLPQEESAFVARMHRSRPDFRVRQLTPHEGERFVIQYVEPLARNEAALGLDLASEPDRRVAALTAVQGDSAVLTPPITLVQESGPPHQSFLMLLPVYRNGSHPASVEDRVASATGWCYAPLSIAEVMGATRWARDSAQLIVRDVTNAAAPVEVHHTAPEGDAQPALRSVTLTRELYGRQWQFVFRVYPAFAAALNLPSVAGVLGLGTLLSFGCAAVLMILRQSRRRHQQLSNARMQLAAVVESSLDGIIGKSLDGHVMSWNHGAELIFGYTAEEAMGRYLASLIVPDELLEEEIAILQAIGRGESIARLETRRRRKDGSIIQVSAAIAPIRGPGGKVIGVSKTVRDITQQKRAEAEIIRLNESLEEEVARRTEELEQARRTLSTVFDALPSMIGYWDKDLINRVANRAYHDWFGLSPETMPGRSFQALLGEEFYESSRTSIEAVLTGLPQHFERNLRTVHGEEKHLFAHYIPDVVDGVVKGFFVIVHDVTELSESRTRLGRALQDNEALLRTINEQLFYSETDANGFIIDANENFCRIHGYRREELLGKRHAFLGSGLHPEGFWRDMWQTLATGKAWHGEICNHTREGEACWFDTVIVPVQGREGAFERYIALRIDITERKAAEAEVRRLNQLLGNVLSASSEISIIATDMEGLITVFNTGSQRMLGYREEDMVGRCSPLVLHLPEELSRRASELEARFGMPFSGMDVFTYLPEHEGAETREWTYLRKDGSPVLISLSVTAMRDADGMTTGYLGIAVDITESKLSAERLLQAKQQAEQASVAKGQFLANMSHEIRTPMNAVLGMLQLVRKTTLDERQIDYVSKAQIAARSMLGLLNDILDFSKIEANKLQLDLHPFDMEDLLRDLAVVLAGNIGEKPLELLFDVSPDLPRCLCGDRLRLQQVLINLAGNAIKFTARGQVTVGIRKLGQHDGRVTLNLHVTDTGIGISPEQMMRIFEGFSQAEASTTRRYGGTGLGLAISQKLVELMGGALAVDSEAGKGSRFHFNLQLEVVEPVAEPVGLPPRLQRLRILVVDDNEMAARMMADSIRAYHWHAAIALSGEEALVAVEQAREFGQPYDLCVMDWRMPGMDGVEAARALRSGGEGANPLVIMVTAFGREVLADLAQSGDAPFAAFLSKPLTPRQLFDAICAAFGEARGTVLAPPEDEGLLFPLSDLNVLVVEDNPLNRQVACELLADAGARVALAEGGLEGVSMALDPARAFDVVLMDVQMPDIDGLEATRRIRAAGATLPIVAMTANVSRADREACLAAGMTEHVGKPIDMEELVPVLLWASGRLAEPAAARSDPAGRADAGGAVDSWPVILARFSQNVSTYRSALLAFEAEGGRLVDRIVQATLVADAKQAALHLHSLKGVAATLGARALAKRAAELEKAWKPGAAEQDRPMGETLASSLGQQLRDALVALHHLLDIEASAPALPAALPRPEPDWPRAIARLKVSLAEGDTAALDQADALAVAAPADVAQGMKQLCALVQDFRFDEALACLDALEEALK